VSSKNKFVLGNSDGSILITVASGIVASGIVASSHEVTAVRSVSFIFGISLIASRSGSFARGFGASH